MGGVGIMDPFKIMEEAERQMEAMMGNFHNHDGGYGSTYNDRHNGNEVNCSQFNLNSLDLLLTEQVTTSLVT